MPLSFSFTMRHIKQKININEIANDSVKKAKSLGISNICTLTLLYAEHEGLRLKYIKPLI